MNLLELPDCMLEEIFLRLSYDEMAKKRLISKKINTICQSLLNRGVAKIISRLQIKIEKLKPLLPRKESLRWNHTVNKEIQCLESFAISVRQLTFVYKDFIEENLCCFIPGKVIDISLSLMRHGMFSWSWLFDDNSVELKDAICMAKEHFRDQIEPNLKKLINEKHIASKMRKLRTKQVFEQTLEQARKKIKENDDFMDSIEKAMKSPDPTPVTIPENSKKARIQDRSNLRNAYLRLNQKHILTNKKYDALLRKVNSNNNAIKKQLTNSRKEVADLRRRLEKFESQHQSVIGEQTPATHLVTKADLKKVFLLSKRLADADKSQNAIGKGTGASHLVTKSDFTKALRSTKRFACDDEFQNRSVIGEQTVTDENLVVENRDIKKALRSSKRLAEAKTTINK